jgi:AraC family transcriptional activator of pobA
MMRSAARAIPAFYLYGEPQRAVREGFVHVESLDDRSRPSEWTIQPHLHRDLNHIFVMIEGGGTMQVDGVTCAFIAPALLLIPAGAVHGFTWHDESHGWVITLADAYVTHLAERDRDLATLFHPAQAIALDGEDHAAVERSVSQLLRELGWIGPGQRSAVEAEVLAILVRALRGASAGALTGDAPGRQALVVAHLRERIEARFRLREPVAVHATALGVSETALRLACARVGGLSPSAMLDERAMLEARRLLLYTDMTVNQIAWSVGFEDAAYFSRFFTRHAGQSPRRFRTARGG